MVHTVEIEVAGRTLRLETGRVARQADGSIWATYGDTVVLATTALLDAAKDVRRVARLDDDLQSGHLAAGRGQDRREQIDAGCGAGA